MKVWKRSCQLAVLIYEVMKTCRDYSLRDQMQRSAVSIASNIAEGSERTGKDFAEFVTVARGSTAELKQIIAYRIGMIENEQMQVITNECQEISKMLQGLRKALQTEN